MFIVLSIFSEAFVDVIDVWCLQISVEILIKIEIVFCVVIEVFEGSEVAVTCESNLCDNCDGKEMRMHV